MAYQPSTVKYLEKDKSGLCSNEFTIQVPDPACLLCVLLALASVGVLLLRGSKVCH